MKIYRKGVEKQDLTIDQSTTIVRRLMVENSLNLSVCVSRKSSLGLKIGDYTEIGSERYVLMDNPTYSLRDGVYQYNVLMRGNLHRLEVYMMPDEGRDEWFYYGSVVDHINKVVAIVNTKEIGWSAVLPDLGELPDKSFKNINYANMSILSAFHAICSPESGWGLEFDVVGKVVKFARQIKTPTQMCFQYGKGKGLYELSRGELSGEKIATRIIGYGGSANMQNGQRLDFESINDGKNYVEKNVDLYGLREERVNFDHIYPRLKDAKITSNAVQVQAGKANWTVATDLDFDLTQQVLDDSVIIFNTGDCVGVEFKIVAYDHPTKTITFTEFADKSGVETYLLPNSDRYPKAGDNYILVNILMPESYIANAKEELLQATIDSLAKRSLEQHPYTVNCDPRYFKKLAYTPAPGDACRLIDAPHGVDVVCRVTGIEYPLMNPFEVKLTLSDKIPVPSGVVMAKSIKEIKTKMSMLDRAQLTENQLRKIFHPLGGNLGIDLCAKNVEVADRLDAKKMVATPFLDAITVEADSITAEIIDVDRLEALNVEVEFAVKSKEVKAESVEATERIETKVVKAAQRVEAEVVDAKIVKATESVNSANFTTVEFVPSMIGYGAGLVSNVDTNQSDLWVDHIHARYSFETLEMRYRQMVVSGEELVVNNGGKIAQTLEAGMIILTTQDGIPIVSQDGTYVVLNSGVEANVVFEIKGEKGIDLQQFVEGDILRYCYRSEGAITSGFIVVRLVVDDFVYQGEIVNGSHDALKVGMTLALFGSQSDTSRQGFIVLSARERTIAIYDKVNSTVIKPDNLKVLLGNLNGVADPAFEGNMTGYGLFSNNCYLKGKFVLHTGKTVESEIDGVRLDLDTQILATAEGLKTKVSKTDFDTLGDRVAEAETAIDVTAEGLKTKVSKTDFDALGNRLQSAETAIDVTAEGLKTKVSLDAFDALGNRLQSAETKITTTAEGLTSKVSKTDFDTLGDVVTKSVSEIKQTASAITLRVEGTESELTEKSNKKSLVSEINQCNEAIRLKANLIKLTGETEIDNAFVDKLQVTNAFIKDLTANSAFIEDLTANSAFIEKLSATDLTVNKLETKPKDLKSRITINDNILNVSDNAGVARISMRGEALPELSALIGGGGRSEASIVGTHWTTAGTYKLNPAWDTNYNDLQSVTTIKGTMTAKAGKLAGQQATRANLVLKAVSTKGDSLVLGNIMTLRIEGQDTEDTKTETLEIDRKVTLPAGNWQLVAEVILTASTCWCLISDFTVTTEYLTSGVTHIGTNGFASIWSSKKYFYLSYKDDSTEPFLQIKGLLDTPGVIAKAQINSQGGISKHWGKSITGVGTTTSNGANKRIYHSIGHNKYTAICSPYGRGVIAEVIMEDTDSVYVYATGNFNIMLIGEN